jgi:hypothetical protein
MQCILYKIYFLKGFSYVLQIDMHFICAPMLTKFYSYKKMGVTVPTWIILRSFNDIITCSRFSSSSTIVAFIPSLMEEAATI